MLHYCTFKVSLVLNACWEAEQRPVVWGNSKQDTQFKLEASGMPVACLSGDMGKEQRQRVLHAFRSVPCSH